MDYAPDVSGECDIVSKWRLRMRIDMPSHLWILSLVLLISISPNSCSARNPHHLPKSAVDAFKLKSAVDACLKPSPKGDCPNSPHGPIEDWDVSRITGMRFTFSDAGLFTGDLSKWDVSSVNEMSGMFFSATAFNGDISKWDVSSVEDMCYMFFEAVSFNRDISKWDVSSVADMNGMFNGAAAFNGYISRWDVSNVIKMDYMFLIAASFKQKLCGAAWVHSQASKSLMFDRSSGSISSTVCVATAFSPKFTAELKSVVDACLKLSPKGFCPNGPHGPIGEWDVSRITDMSFMFSFEGFFTGDISKWDVSSVTEMSGTFCTAGSFNGDISKWDVSSVKDMCYMFIDARAFNGDISKWEVSSVTDMRGMFNAAAAFNIDVSKWDVLDVTKMDHMFLLAASFRQKLCGPAWVHSKASKSLMFDGSFGSISSTVCVTLVFSPQSKEELASAVNACIELAAEGDCHKGRPIGEWDVSSITDMAHMFSDTRAFNIDISKWEVSRVTEMSGMFKSATGFNGDISKWDVSSVNFMSGMFWNAIAFNGDISKWDVSSTTSMYGMFQGAESFNGDLSKWDVSSVTEMSGMFCSSLAFDGDISKWDVSSVEDMCDMFSDARSFNGDISKWDVSSVTKMNGMFNSATAFNGVIWKWDVSSVTDMKHMFQDAKSFNQKLCGAAWVHSKARKSLMFDGSSGSISSTVCVTPVFSPQSKEEIQNVVNTCLKLPDCSNGPHGPIGEWDISRATDMTHMFSGAVFFNSDISKWDVSSVTDMTGMFWRATLFNGDISKWDVSSVTTTSVMFFEAVSFNRDISKWDVSNVADMNGMFNCAAAFNRDISKWDVSSVTKMSSMFWVEVYQAFNGDISKWDVSRVIGMDSMFNGAEAFNGDISKWDVSRVEDMSRMFCYAYSFNGDLSRWDVSNVIKMDYMFFYAASFKQKLCGAAWVHSRARKKFMFTSSSGSISRTVCEESAAHTRANRPTPARDLIARTPISTPFITSAMTTKIANAMACPKCGMFGKSGTASCCARGGAWYKNCGGTGSRNADHKWSEGVEACKLTTTAISSVCPKCGTIQKSGKASCCGRGGSWFKNCGDTSTNTKLHHTWYEGIQACKTRWQPKPTIGQPVNAAQSKITHFSNDADMVNSTTVITPVNTFDKSTPMNHPDQANMSILTNRDTVNSRSVTASGNTITSTSALTPMVTSSNNMLMNTPVHTSDSKSITVQGCERMLNIFDHINFLLIIVISL